MNALKVIFAFVMFGVVGGARKTENADSTSPTTRPTKMTAATMPSARKSSAKAIRIDAGSQQPFVDAEGNSWDRDSGFSGGGLVNRGNINIENTRNPGLYR